MKTESIKLNEENNSIELTEPVSKRHLESADFHVENHGTIFLVRPMNDIASNHLRDNVQEDAQWMGDALVVEHRYISDLVAALHENGYAIE